VDRSDRWASLVGVDVGTTERSTIQNSKTDAGEVVIDSPRLQALRREADEACDRLFDAVGILPVGWQKPIRDAAAVWLKTMQACRDEEGRIAREAARS